MKQLYQKYKSIIVALLIGGMSTSCSWLDVSPQAQMNEEQMFSNPEGFEHVLLGIYTSMTRESMYGQDMTFGMMDVVGQYYNIYKNQDHGYYYISQLNYTHEQFLNHSRQTWLDCYNSIANCNVLLEALDGKESSFFEGNKYRLIKGEALALRAYLHFDLFRMFAPSWGKAKDVLTIPYADSFTKKIHAQLKGEEVIRKVVADLDSAKNLLNGIDPVLEGGYKVMDNHFNSPQEASDLFLSYRGYRMNYYAVLGLLARVHFYIGSNSEAAAYAEQVITAKEEGYFQFTSETAFKNPQASRDVQQMNELLFALNDVKVVDRWFSLSNSANTAFRIVNNSSFYSKGDFRLYLLENAAEEDKTASLKYARLSENAANTNNKLPMLRMSEMYIIAAEAGYATDKTKAISRLSELKTNRGVSMNMTGYSFEQLQDETLLEAKRELLGEGQLFYWYKQRNLAKIKRGNEVIDMPIEKYTFPLPSTEVEFGDRVQP